MTEKEQSAQQPPKDEQEDEQPKRRRGRAAGAKAATGEKAQGDASGAQNPEADESQRPKRRTPDSGQNDKPQAQASNRGKERAGQSESDDTTAQAPSVGTLDLSRLLQEQISQAIQPVLQDFRQQLATSVQHEVEQGQDQPKKEAASEMRPQQTLDQETPESEDGQVETETVQRKPEQEAAPKPARDESEDESETATAEREDQPSSQPAQASAEEPSGEAKAEDSEHTTESPEQKTDEQTEEGGLVKSGVRPTLDSAVKLVERQAEHVLESALTTAIDAVLAESTRAAVERGTEKGIHAALDRVSGAVGDNSTVREIRTQTESTLLAIVGEALDAVYADSLRENLHQQAEAASRELLQRNFGAAMGHLSEVLQTIVQEIIDVLRHQWQRLLRLLLKVILAALDDAPSQSDTPRLSGGKGRAGESAGS